MTKEKVSVIIPVYNTENYIEKCVESLISQTYKNIEIIMIDDCSKDSSYEKCQKLSKKYSNIVVRKQEKNKGQSEARNIGINIATGSYLLFLDSDDTLLPNTIESMLNKAISDDSDIALSSFSRVVDGKINLIFKDKLEEKRYTSKEIASLLIDIIPLNVISCIGTKLYRTSLIRDNGILFDNKYRYNEDGAFAITAFGFSNYISYIDEPFYQYLYRSEESAQISYRKDMYNYLIAARNLVKDYFVKSDCYDEKKIEYNLMRFEIAFSSLLNEVRYKKDFDGVYNQIISDVEMNGSFLIVKNIKQNFYFRSVLKCLMTHNKAKLLRYLKLYEFIRSIKHGIKR